ncbi:MAG TPA: acetyl-CoA acetyltransferase, partial [Erythrobacter sp.]|nr:acetyl-CoA acetyltransferase [Erythrobacter sp.]
LDRTYEGPATIESYTVHYGRDGSPKSGVIVALTPSGSRTLAGVAGDDAAMITFLTDGMHEPVGSAGNVTRGDGDLSMWVRG